MVRQPTPEKDLATQAKEYLAEARFKLLLFDLVGTEVAKLTVETSDAHFPSTAAWSPEEFRKRVGACETLLADLTIIQALLGYWSTPAMHASLTLPVKRLSAQLIPANGTTAWLSLRWYPCVILLYAGGVAAVAAQQYGNLRRLFEAKTTGEISRQGHREAVVRAVVRGISDVADAFKLLPGHERHHVARSEHLFKLLRPKLDDLLFLGSDYEAAFDEFEVLMALEYAHQEGQSGDNVWGPVGRFGWKYSGHAPHNPYHDLVSEAKSRGTAWSPVAAGLFGGSTDRFLSLAESFGGRLARLGWF